MLNDKQKARVEAVKYLMHVHRDAVRDSDKDCGNLCARGILTAADEQLRALIAKKRHK